MVRCDTEGNPVSEEKGKLAASIPSYRRKGPADQNDQGLQVEIMDHGNPGLNEKGEKRIRRNIFCQ